MDNIPVKIKLTSDFEANIDKMLSGAEKALGALDIAELCTLSSNSDVKEYILTICREFQAHKTEIDKMISDFAFGWDIERLFKIHPKYNIEI